MACKEEANEPLNNRIWELKVSIHCEGCKKKVKKILRNINGVHSVDIDSQQNKVTVTGDVDADALIGRLAKSGKHADMWPEKKQVKPKAKDKEKESETAPETSVKNLLAVEEVAATEPGKKPVEKTKKLADTEAQKREEEQADTDSETDTKPAETSAKATGSGKKTGNKQGESSSTSSEPVAMEGHSGSFPHNQLYPAYQVPVYQRPAYAVSHNTVHPMASHSYYYAPVPPMPQSYTHLGHPYPYNRPPVPPQHSEYYRPVVYNHYNSDNHHYGPSMDYRASQSHSYSYYGSSVESKGTEPHSHSYYETQEPLQSYSYHDSSEPRASPSRSYSTQGGLDMFSDENANGCNVM